MQHKQYEIELYVCIYIYLLVRIYMYMYSIHISMKALVKGWLGGKALHAFLWHYFTELVTPKPLYDFLRKY